MYTVGKSHTQTPSVSVIIKNHLYINIKSLYKTVTMAGIEDYKATLDSTKKQRFDILERRWFHIEHCYNLLDMHLDPTIRTTTLLIEDEARLFSRLDQIAGARRSRDINENVPFVEPSKSRLNSFQKSELKVFASYVYFDVQFIQCPVGINFETKEATCL
jgi:hypothetical protein